MRLNKNPGTKLSKALSKTIVREIFFLSNTNSFFDNEYRIKNDAKKKKKKRT